jgi:putative hydrolase of the HAD superfamily
VTDDARVVFWDFDGTLARRDGLWASALAEAWRRCGGSPLIGESQLQPFLGYGFPWHSPQRSRRTGSAADWWNALLPVLVEAYASAGGERPLAREAAREVPAIFYRTTAWSVIDGAMEALALTRDAGYRNIILSNHPPELPTLVDSLGLSRLVERTITSALVGADKPHPSIFRHALHVAGDPDLSDVWMIGDNPIADVEGARSAGLRGILADGDYPDSIGMTVLQAAAHVVENAP